MGSNLGHVGAKETTALIIFLMDLFDLFALNKCGVRCVLIRSGIKIDCRRRRQLSIGYKNIFLIELPFSFNTLCYVLYV